MATYEPNLVGLPPWVVERVQMQGITTTAQVFHELIASADEDDDSVSAAAYTMWVAAMESSRNYPGTASRRATFMTLRKA